MQLKALPQKWNLPIQGMEHQLTLEEIRELHFATQEILLEQDSEVDAIIRFVCKKRRIEPERIFLKVKTEELCTARWCVWRLLNEKGMSYSAIARKFKKTHSTIKFGLASLAFRMKNDIRYRKELAWLENGTV